MEKILAEKNIIITGASRGLGRSIAQAMWKNGASLFLVARAAEDLEGLRKELGTTAHARQHLYTAAVDLKMPEASDMLITQAKRVWNKLDGLVNNAGIIGPIGRVWENDWHTWQETIQVNLIAPIGLCRACIPWMKSGGGGKIINLSGGGASDCRPHFTAYAVAKTGLVRFTEILAHEVKDLNIQVNSVAPGALNTDMFQEILEAGPEKTGPMEYAKALQQKESGGVPLQRAANLCVFLVSQASNGLTGKLISAVWDPWMDIPKHLEDLTDSDIYTLRRIVPKDRDKEWG